VSECGWSDGLSDWGFADGFDVLVVVSVEGVPVLNLTWWSGSLLTFRYPPMNMTGYVNLTVANPNGGNVTLTEWVYYTSDCPFEGAVPFLDLARCVC